MESWEKQKRNLKKPAIPNARRIKCFSTKLLQWSHENGRSFPWRQKSLSNFKIIISEVLLQRTRAETVAKIFPGFVKRFPSWNKLAIAKEKDLEKYLKPLGLWRQRTPSVKKLALEMAKRNGRFPRIRAEIEALPGIGQYIANSVQLFCHGTPKPLIDVNMARVLERYFGPRKLADIRDDPYLQALAEKVVSHGNPVLINWAILDLAAIVCGPRKPHCKTCILKKRCRFLETS